VVAEQSSLLAAPGILGEFVDQLEVGGDRDHQLCGRCRVVHPWYRNASDSSTLTVVGSRLSGGKTTAGLPRSSSSDAAAEVAPSSLSIARLSTIKLLWGSRIFARSRCPTWPSRAKSPTVRAVDPGLPARPPMHRR